MSFQPLIPNAGLAGWRFLQRTYDAQFEAFNKAPELQRNSEYFTENIGKIESAEDLVADPRLLSVALGAFGLQDDINNRYFIQKILEDGTADDEALANRLADDRYQKLSDAFGFGPGETITVKDADLMGTLAQQNRVQAFEVSVGEQDDSMRVALFAQRELENIANEGSNEDAKWFSLMSLPPLRSMFETALGLPSEFGQIDIDQQLDVFRDKTLALTGNGSVSQFADPEARERLTNLFLARSQIANLNLATSSGANALTLLRASQI